MRRLWEDLVLAAMLLARIPVPRAWQPAELPPLARGVWSYPVIGALLGLLGGAVFALARGLGMPPALAAGWTLAAMLLLGGGLHEDGLADTADGFGGGRDRERKLAIMRDSRIGSYGVLALLLSLGLRGTALAALAEPRAVLPALVVSGALGRAAILLVLRLVPPARPDGLAAALGRPGWRAIAPGFAPAAAAALLCLPPGRAVAALLLAAACAALLAWLARRQVGGQTGDVLGATAQLAECAVLTLLASG